MNQHEPQLEAAPASTPGLLPVYLTVGLVQGLALWWLTRSNGAVFVSNDVLRAAALHFAAAAPALWYLLADSARRGPARAAVAAVIALLVSGLAAHAAATSPAGHEPFSFKL